MDPMDLDTWPIGTTINYDCGQAVIDTDPDKSIFILECVFNDVSNLYEWNSSEGYSKVPKCVLGEYLRERTV